MKNLFKKQKEEQAYYSDRKDEADMNQLDKNIAVNLKRIRKSRNMSLDMMAERTGVSKSMLGQIPL